LVDILHRSIISADTESAEYNLLSALCQVVTSGVLKGYVQGAGGPTTTLYIGLYVFQA